MKKKTIRDLTTEISGMYLRVCDEAERLMDANQVGPAMQSNIMLSEFSKNLAAQIATSSVTRKYSQLKTNELLESVCQEIRDLTRRLVAKYEKEERTLDLDLEE